MKRASRQRRVSALNTVQQIKSAIGQLPSFAEASEGTPLEDRATLIAGLRN